MKPSNGKTVWRNEEKKWKPRNLQAARVLFPAHGFNLPPENKDPVFAETMEQRLDRERKERHERLQLAIKEADEKKEKRRKKKEQEAQQALVSGKKTIFQRKMDHYKKKQLKKLADVAANIANSNGLYRPRRVRA